MHSGLALPQLILQSSAIFLLGQTRPPLVRVGGAVTGVLVAELLVVSVSTEVNEVSVLFIVSAVVMVWLVIMSVMIDMSELVVVSLSVVASVSVDVYLSVVACVSIIVFVSVVVPRSAVSVTVVSAWVVLLRLIGVPSLLVGSVLVVLSPSVGVDCFMVDCRLWFVVVTICLVVVVGSSEKSAISSGEAVVPV